VVSSGLYLLREVCSLSFTSRWQKEEADIRRFRFAFQPLPGINSMALRRIRWGGAKSMRASRLIGFVVTLIVLVALFNVVSYREMLARPLPETTFWSRLAFAKQTPSPTTKPTPQPTLRPTPQPTPPPTFAAPLRQSNFVVPDVCTEGLQVKDGADAKLFPPLAQSVFHRTQDCLRNSPFAPREPVSALCNRSHVPNVDLQAHYEVLLEITKPWRGLTKPSYANYSGPWSEDRWIQEFCCNVSVISDFGGVVPLFVQWNSVRLSPRFGLEGFFQSQEAKRIFSVLRDDVLYVTMAEASNGMYPLARNQHRVSPARFWNVLVLSPGGFGHIPLPLLAAELPLGPPLRYKDVRYLFSFHGTISPQYGTRVVMVDVVDRMMNKAHSDLRVSVGEISSDWKQVMNDTLLNLAPRGFGKTSFRLYEVIQMGRGVPVHLWDDDEWIPYRGTKADLRNFGFSVHIDDFEQFVLNVTDGLRKNPKHFNLAERQRNMRRLRQYFTFKGMLRQIRYFFENDPRCLLRCETHPLVATIGDA